MGKENIRLTQLTGNVNALGQVHFFDDFSADLGYDESITGSGEAIRSITDSVVKGISLLHQVAGDTPTADDAISSQKRIPCTPDQYLNFICYFKFSGSALPHFIRFKLTLTDGTDLLQYSVEYNVADAALKYLNSGGGYSVFNTYGAPPDDNFWHKIDIIVDGLNRKYISCKLDNDKFDLADIACQVTTGRTAINHYVNIHTNGAAATNFDVWYDHLLLQSFS